MNLASDECTWVVDYGASFHLPPMTEYILSYTFDYYGYVRMGNVVANSAGELWHKRLGHISKTGLQMLDKKDILLVYSAILPG